MIETAVIVGTVVLLVAIALVLVRQGHPENAGRWSRKPKGPADTVYPPGSRPGGPGETAQTPEDLYGDDRPPPRT